MADLGYFVVIHPDGSIEKVATPGGAKEIQRFVGGFFENVYFNVYFENFPITNVIASVNEEGKLIGLPINHLATYIYRDPYDYIVGDFVIQKLDRVGEFNELDQLPFSNFEAEALIDILSIYKFRFLMEEDF